MTSIVCFVIGIVITLIPTIAVFIAKTDQAPDPNKMFAWGVLITSWYIATAVSHYIGLP